MNQGWTCPKCSKVYAPTVTECHACNASVVRPYPPMVPDYPPMVPDYPPTSPTIPDPYWPSLPQKTTDKWWWQTPIVTCTLERDMNEENYIYIKGFEGIKYKPNDSGTGWYTVT